MTNFHSFKNSAGTDPGLTLWCCKILQKKILLQKGVSNQSDFIKSLAGFALVQYTHHTFSGHLEDMSLLFN